MNDKIIENIVAFAILMENNDGIMGKSPDYIMEKFVRYVDSKDPEAFMWGLDSDNAQKLLDWKERWYGNR